MIEIKPAPTQNNEIGKLQDHLDEMFTLFGYMTHESEWEGEKRLSLLLFTNQGTLKTYSGHVRRCVEHLASTVGTETHTTGNGNTRYQLNTSQDLMVTAVDLGNERTGYRVYMA